MAEETQKIVYFPEIPPKEELLNPDDARIDGRRDILPGSITGVSFAPLPGENTAWGDHALGKVIPFGTSGVDINQGRRNTLVGYQAGFNIQIGHDNVGIGKTVLYTLDS